MIKIGNRLLLKEHISEINIRTHEPSYVNKDTTYSIEFIMDNGNVYESKDFINETDLKSYIAMALNLKKPTVGRPNALCDGCVCLCEVSGMWFCRQFNKKCSEIKSCEEWEDKNGK